MAWPRCTYVAICIGGVDATRGRALLQGHRQQPLGGQGPVDPQAGPMAGQGQEARWPRIGGQAVNDLGDGLAHGASSRPQRAAGARPDIDGVGGHVRQPYRSSSALTCSHGIDSPGSSIAASSSASSAARSASITDSGTMAATRIYPDAVQRPSTATGASGRIAGNLCGLLHAC